jgi:hypothetical protein
MGSWASRLAAGVALVALLACSGLGLCWRQIARDAHDCCENSSSAIATPTRACASVVASEASVKVIPPAVRTVPVSFDLLVAMRSTRVVEVSAPTLPPKAAPLVLRI